jgi:tetratricopeptide (TPR) repeat protein
VIARVLVMLVLATRVASADSDAERLYQEGQAAYDAKRYTDAIAAWDKAYALSKLPALVFNLAQAHRLAGHCQRAHESYRTFIQLDPTAEDRPAAEQFMRELDSCAHPGPKTNPAVRTGPTTPRYEDRGGGKRVAGLVIGGSGVAMIAGGIFFGNRATTIAQEVKDACTSGCEWATLEAKDADGRRAATLQYVFLGAGTAAVATGVWFYIRGARAREVLVEPRAGGAVVRVGGRF